MPFIATRCIAFLTATICIACAFGQTSTPAWQVAAGGPLSFDVASVRPEKPGAFVRPTILLTADDKYSPTSGEIIVDFPVDIYIAFAYKMQLSAAQRDEMLSKLPKWVSTQRFVIHARAAATPRKDQIRLMMQSLLADRFKLATHLETQDTDVLALTLVRPGRLGPNLVPHEIGPACTSSSVPEASSQTAGAPVWPPTCDYFMGHMTADHLFQAGERNTRMSELIGKLSSLGEVKKTLVDQTGLAGSYDFTLAWSPDPTSPMLPPDEKTLDPQGPGFQSALKDQLGLKLVPTTVRLERLVIDHIELPTEN